MTTSDKVVTGKIDYAALGISIETAIKSLVTANPDMSVRDAYLHLFSTLMDRYNCASGNSLIADYHCLTQHDPDRFRS